MEGEERILSAKKKREVLSNLTKKRVEPSKPQWKWPFLFMLNRQNSLKEKKCILRVEPDV